MKATVVVQVRDDGPACWWWGWLNAAVFWMELKVELMGFGDRG